MPRKHPNASKYVLSAMKTHHTQIMAELKALRRSNAPQHLIDAGVRALSMAKQQYGHYRDTGVIASGYELNKQYEEERDREMAG